MRTHTANDLVQLPRFDALGALALGEQLVTAGKSVPELPQPLFKAYEGVATTLDLLRHASAARLPVPSEGDSKRAQGADRWVDAVASGTFDWLTGWSKLSNVPQADVARSLLVELFPTGLKFVRLPFKLEWAEIEARLVRIEASGLDAKFQLLGGAAFLTQLREAHKEYGEALGITGTLPVAAPTAGVRDAYDSFMIALRSYVLKVAAHVEPDQPETGELAAILLAPLQEWRVGTAGGGADALVEEPTSEAAPTNPNGATTP
jgi:hypothetical protein